MYSTATTEIIRLWILKDILSCTMSHPYGRIMGISYSWKSYGCLFLIARVMWRVHCIHYNKWLTVFIDTFGITRPPRHYVFSFSVHPSQRFPCITLRTHGKNGIKFGMLVYSDHLQNWLHFGSSTVDFPHYGEILTRWNVSYLGFGHYLENAWNEWPQIWHAGVPWLLSELNRFWSCYIDFLILALFLNR